MKLLKNKFFILFVVFFVISALLLFKIIKVKQSIQTKQTYNLQGVVKSLSLGKKLTKDDLFCDTTDYFVDEYGMTVSEAKNFITHPEEYREINGIMTIKNNSTATVLAVSPCNPNNHNWWVDSNNFSLYTKDIKPGEEHTGEFRIIIKEKDLGLYKDLKSFALFVRGDFMVTTSDIEEIFTNDNCTSTLIFAASPDIK